MGIWNLTPDSREAIVQAVVWRCRRLSNSVCDHPVHRHASRTHPARLQPTLWTWRTNWLARCSNNWRLHVRKHAASIRSRLSENSTCYKLQRQERNVCPCTSRTSFSKPAPTCLTQPHTTSELQPLRQFKHLTLLLQLLACPCRHRLLCQLRLCHRPRHLWHHMT